MTLGTLTFTNATLVFATPSPPAETISVDTPVTVAAGATMTITGTYANVTPTALDFEFDNAGYGAASSPTIGGGVFSFTATAPAVGSHTVSVRDHDHTSIFGTSGNFSTITVSVSNIRNAMPWAAATFSAGNRITNASKAYECINPGTSTAAPTGSGTSINNGGVAAFKYSSAVDFTDLNAWGTSNVGTLTSPIAAYVWNDQPSSKWDGTVNITGITTSPTADMTITAAPGESFSDNPTFPLGAPDSRRGVCLTQNTAAYTPTLSVTSDYVTVSRLQVTNAAGGSGSGGIDVSSKGTVHIKQNIICDNGHHDAGPLGVSGPGTNQVTAIIENNTLPWHGGISGGPGDPCRGIVLTNPSSNSRIVNNTFVRSTDMFPEDPGFDFFFITNLQSPAQAFTIRNNAFFGAGNDFGYPPATPQNNFQADTDGHNATDDANFGVASTNTTIGCLTSVPYNTSLFNVIDNSAGSLDLRLPVGSALIGAGSGVGAPTTNIFGQARGGTINIGAV